MKKVTSMLAALTASFISVSPLPAEEEENLRIIRDIPHIGGLFLSSDEYGADVAGGETGQGLNLQIEKLVSESSELQARLADIQAVLAEKNAELELLKKRKLEEAAVKLWSTRAKELEAEAEVDLTRYLGQLYLSREQESLPKFAIGVRVQDAENGDGVEIIGVESDTPAEQSGFRAGDVIKGVSVIKLPSRNALTEIIGAVGEGEMDFTVLREGKDVVIRCTPSERSQHMEARLSTVPSVKWANPEGKLVAPHAVETLRYFTPGENKPPVTKSYKLLRHPESGQAATSEELEQMKKDIEELKAMVKLLVEKNN